MNPGAGNRQDNRQRGNAAQLLEKYKGLARDAQMQGDRVQTEYFLQFADHYFRVLGESRARFAQVLDSAMDAINFFDEYQGLEKGKFIRNQFGFTLGGPLSFLRRGDKRTFFFTNYEGTIQRQAVTSILQTPTARMQQSNFTDMSDLIRLQRGTRRGAEPERTQGE